MKKKKSTTKKNSRSRSTTWVWILQYSHKHGDDFTVHMSYEEAELEAVDTILNWLSDIDDETILRHILERISLGSFSDAIHLWQNWQCEEGLNESLEIFQQEMMRSTKTETRDLAHRLTERADEILKNIESERSCECEAKD